MMVLQLVARERARLSLAIVARGAALALSVIAVVVALSVMALGDARWITRPAAPLFVWGAALSLVAAALWWTVRAIRRHASAASVAAAIERERALRSGALRGALEVAAMGALGRRAAESLAGELRVGGALAPVTQWRAWRRGLAAAGVAVLALVALGAARDASPDGWRAVRHPVRAWTGSLLGRLVIVDPPRTVLRGEHLRLLILAPERRQVTLSTRTTGARWQTQLVPVSGGSAAVTLGPLDADIVLVAADGRVSTDSVVVRVTDRPFVGDVAIRAQFPAYLGRTAEVIAVGEPARIPRGTVLDIRGRASTTLSMVGLVRSGDTLRLAADGHSFTGRLTALQSGLWTWTALGTHGPIADVPPALDLEVLPDSAPRVEILAPAGDTLVLSGDRVALRAAATDDHAVAYVHLRSWRRPGGGQPQPEVAQPLAAPNAPQWSGETELDLAVRSLVPGDALHVVVVATDASPWRQTGVSRELVLRIPTLEERREMARALGDSAAAHASAAAKAQRQLEQRTGEAARARGQRAQIRATDPEGRGERSSADRSPQAMSFEAAERSRALAQEQQQLQERVRALQRDAQSLEQQLKAAGALDTALARQLRDAQQLLGEALTPELQAQLDKLQEATQRLSAEDVRRSLAELQEQQRRLREQLERTAEMLKRAALEGSMQTLRDDAQELAAKERAIADSLARGDSAASQRSRALAERSRALSEQIGQVAKRLQQEKAQSGPERLQDAARSAERSADAMRRAATGERGQQQRQRDAQEQAGGDAGRQREQQGGAEQGARGEGQQARADAAREGARQMESAAQQLADARQSQISEWKQELTGELDRSIQEALQLARQQSALAERAKRGEQAEQMRGDQSAVQQGTQKVSERLQRAAGKSAHVSPQSQSAVGDARRKVEDATEQVGESRRGGGEAAAAMEEAAQALNRAAAALVRDRERAASAQSASGFAEMLQQMQEMAKQQGQINAQSAGLMPTPGQQPGAEALERARALGQRQRSLARQLEGDGSGGSARADQMAKEMREIADALEQGRLDQAMLDRQQRLFRRLLDAGLSLEKEEREDRGERESRAAAGSEVQTPGGAAQGRSAVRFREPTWAELRGLSAEERRAVLEYFKRINAERP